MTPTPDWYDADTDDADRYPHERTPVESTADYVRRLTTELAEARAESERLRAKDEDQRGALTLILTEHRVWVEALTGALDRVESVEPRGSDEWVRSGEAMRKTALREIRNAVAGIDAPTIERRAEVFERAEAELAALRGRIQALADNPTWERYGLDRDLRALLVPVDAPTPATDTPDTTTEQETALDLATRDRAAEKRGAVKALRAAEDAALTMHDAPARECIEWANWLRARADRIEADRA